MSNRMALTRDERKAQTREAIIEAASRLFALNGIEATSIDRIAQEIGLTKGAVYSTFTNKHALVEAVATAGSLIIDIDPLFRDDLPLRDRLRILAQEFNRLRVKVTRQLMLLDLEMYLYAQRHKNFRDEMRAEIQMMAREEGARLEEVAHKRNEPLPIPGDEFMTALTGFARGLVQELTRSPNSVSSESIERLFEALAEPSTD